MLLEIQQRSCASDLSLLVEDAEACGVDDIPAEYWKALCSREDAAELVLELCNACWREKSIPHEWHVARVASIFKKGDPTILENYRPIAVLPILYKLFSRVLLERIKLALSQAQSVDQAGFKSGFSCDDHIFRRVTTNTLHARAARSEPSPVSVASLLNAVTA